MNAKLYGSGVSPKSKVSSAKAIIFSDKSGAKEKIRTIAINEKTIMIEKARLVVLTIRLFRCIADLRPPSKPENTDLSCRNKFLQTFECCFVVKNVVKQQKLRSTTKSNTVLQVNEDVLNR